MAYTNGISSHTPALSSVVGTTGTGRTQGGAATTEVREPAARPELRGSARTARTGDQASVSSTGGLIAQALSGSSDVRTEKVAALQASIASGTYSVPANAVASKLVDHLLG